MTRRACAVLAILAAACGQGDPARSRADPGPTGGRSSGQDPASSATDRSACEPLPFARTTPVPEASGAAWLTLDGKPALVIVGDSGNHGAYGVLDPETGATMETGELPLSDGASDDLEGLAGRGDRMYGLTSSGWIRVWRRKDRGFELVDGPYPLGPVDLPDTKNKRHPPQGDGMVCGGRAINCGRDYEGLCLAPGPHPDSCVGFAAAKADGHLYCLTDEGGKLVVHHDRAIAITEPGALADCAFAEDGTLWAGSNLFDVGHVYRVAHWEDPAHAQVERVAALPIGFPELIAARGDIVYRMSDMGGAPSLMVKYRCRR